MLRNKKDEKIIFRTRYVSDSGKNLFKLTCAAQNCQYGQSDRPAEEPQEETLRALGEDVRKGERDRFAIDGDLAKTCGRRFDEEGFGQCEQLRQRTRDVKSVIDRAHIAGSDIEHHACSRL